MSQSHVQGRVVLYFGGLVPDTDGRWSKEAYERVLELALESASDFKDRGPSTTAGVSYNYVRQRTESADPVMEPDRHPVVEDS